MPPPGRKPTTLSFVPRGQENCPFYPLLNETPNTPPSSQHCECHTSYIRQRV